MTGTQMAALALILGGAGMIEPRSGWIMLMLIGVYCLATGWVPTEQFR